MGLRGAAGGVVLIGIKFFGGRVEESSLVFIKLVLSPPGQSDRIGREAEAADDARIYDRRFREKVFYRGNTTGYITMHCRRCTFTGD
jgi:hypothetical protein